MKRREILDQIYLEISVVSTGEKTKLLRSLSNKILDKTSEHENYVKYWEV